MARRPLRARMWAWLVAMAANAAACRSSQPRAPTWSSDGGPLGERVRAGEWKNVQHVQFRSHTLQRDVGALVVTPPGYAAQGERRYPVVYVFPGIGGDEWSYLRDQGLDNVALRALFEDPARAPLVVFGNPGDSAGHAQAASVLADELVGYVDQHYRTRQESSGRSLEGFSLGGATVLNLLLHRPDVFGRAVALSSACYLLSNCGEIRAGLVARAKLRPAPPVLLAVGAREIPQNRAISEELAPLFGVGLSVLPNADHDWGAQLATAIGGREFGRQVAEFHLAGFTPPR